MILEQLFMIIDCQLYEGVAYIFTADGDVWQASVDVDGWMEFEQPLPIDIPQKVLALHGQQVSYNG
jgi:hypothetical protein